MDSHQNQHSRLPGMNSSSGNDNNNSVANGNGAPTQGNPGFHPALHHGATTGSNGPGMNPQLMGQLMTNPALAAAAAASPLFPPAAMLTNPGAFLTMPEYYTSAAALQNDQNAKGSTAAISSAVSAKAHQVTAGQSSQPGFPVQLQHSHQYQPQHGATQMFSLPNPIVPYGAALPPPGMVPNQLAPSSVQAHMLASAAASLAAANTVGDFDNDDDTVKGGKRNRDLTPAERAKQNRERNREHAKSTRLRKKAYIQKLKELVEELHAERTEEVRQRRVAIQHLAEMQNVRRAVIRSFLRFHSNYERDRRKWETLLEDSFWMKQPVTPYRCFRRSEIEQECRISRGVDGVIADAASVSAMIEGVGSRCARWVQIKREDFLLKEEERTGRKRMPKNIMQQSNRFQHAVSSLSSSSNSSNNGGSSGEEAKKKQSRTATDTGKQAISGKTARMSSQNPSGEFHDYHAKPLPDPKLSGSDQGRSSSSPSAEDDSPEESNSDDMKRISTDTSSGDDSAAAIKESRATKRRKVDLNKTAPKEEGVSATNAHASQLPQNIAKKGGIAHSVVPAGRPPTSQNGNSRLALAPAVQLPPFAGIGKRPNLPLVGAAAFVDPSVSLSGGADDPTKTGIVDGDKQGVAKVEKRPDLANVAVEGHAIIPSGPAVISGDFETSSSNSSRSKPQIRAYYHVNEDDMILMEDIIMCPFVFRTQDAVLCGALAECVMPGMLRGHFSSRNKLASVEMIYDAMGFMQQLERASGSELMAQIIPGSLEMALSPGSPECRVITLAEPPFRIVNVNETWTKLTKYTQMEVEGVELFSLLDPPPTEDQPSNPPFDLDDVMEGRCKCATRLHCDKDGREFVDFISSYPLTNANDEITHILHISKELPSLEVSDENQESSATMDETND